MNTIINFETNVSTVVSGSAQSMADKLNISKSSVNRILKGATACGFELITDVSGTFNVAEPTQPAEEHKTVSELVDGIEPVEVEVEVAKNANTEVTATRSKADVARDVFATMYGKQAVTPKMIKDEMIQKAGLSKAGASTYYYNMKKKADAAE